GADFRHLTAGITGLNRHSGQAAFTSAHSHFTSANELGASQRGPVLKAFEALDPIGQDVTCAGAALIRALPSPRGDSPHLRAVVPSRREVSPQRQNGSR